VVANPDDGFAEEDVDVEEEEAAAGDDCACLPCRMRSVDGFLAQRERRKGMGMVRARRSKNV
jgi:hypothetical protein